MKIIILIFWVICNGGIFRDDFLVLIREKNLDQIKARIGSKDLNREYRYLNLSITPLHFSAHFGSDETTRLLLGNGADVFLNDFRGLSTLEIFARDCNNEIVKAILENIDIIPVSKAGRIIDYIEHCKDNVLTELVFGKLTGHEHESETFNLGKDQVPRELYYNKFRDKLIPQDIIKIFKTSRPLYLNKSIITEFLQKNPTQEEIFTFRNNITNKMALANEALVSKKITSVPDFFHLYGINRENFGKRFINSRLLFDIFLDLNPSIVEMNIFIQNLSSSILRSELSQIIRSTPIPSGRVYFELHKEEILGKRNISYHQNEFIKYAKSMEEVVDFSRHMENPGEFLDLVINSGMIKNISDFMKISERYSSLKEDHIGLFLSFNPNFGDVYNIMEKSNDSRFATYLLVNNLFGSIEDFIKFYNFNFPHEINPEVLEQFMRMRPNLKEFERFRSSFNESCLFDEAKTNVLRFAELRILEEIRRDIDEHGRDFKVSDETRVQKSGVCNVCLEESQVYKCENERCHDYLICKECLRIYVDQEMKEERFPLKCSNCREHILAVGRDILLDDEADRLERETIKEIFQELHRGVRKCPTEGCIGFIDIDQESRECQCCGIEICGKCLKSHPGLTCIEFQDQDNAEMRFERLVHDPRSDVRPCPYCLTPSQKIDNCDHLHCRKCNKMWDWCLGKVIGRYNYDYRPRLYRVGGDRGVRRVRTGFFGWRNEEFIYEGYQDKP